MIVKVYLKDPDGFSESVDEAVKTEVAKLGLSEDEAEAVFEKRREKVWAALERWVEYQEYVGITFDIEAGIATVLRSSRS